MYRRTSIAAVTLALLTGCAATVKKGSSDASLPRFSETSASKLVLNVGGSPTSIGSQDWAGFKAEWKDNFQEQAATANVPFEMQEGPPRSTNENGTLLYVYVNDYRFIRPGTRYLTGVLSGNAFIDSKFTFTDLKTGSLLGSQTANTSSSAWEGVFSPMTNKQVEAIAIDVFKQIKAGAGNK
ncbi:MAG: hypothetical protein JNJ44_10050 [Zoogloeaceae bacterium]|nr:hypothetical protein [Zoogloeaceae bacterium]